MKLGLRIFGAYLVIFCICFAVPAGWVLNTLRTRYLEGVEDPLADQANILAAGAARLMAAGRFDPAGLTALFNQIYNRPLDARIYHLTKDRVDMIIYITDAAGRVLFHSRDPGQVGADYSDWHDVRMTLEGRYGARTSLADPEDPTSAVLFVAAPIRTRDRLAGVLTVGKPTTNINSFIRQAKPQLIQVAGLAVAAAILLGYLVALWITRPIKRLTAYATAIHNGEKAIFPRLDNTEIGAMGNALEKMRQALEGKAYVERYVQQLTHEIKSPLSGIRGSAELLEEQMPPAQRRRFLTHIRTEAGRIQAIVDRLLTLAALENRQQLTDLKPLAVGRIIDQVMESQRPLLIAKNIDVAVKVADGLTVVGDAFWLHQALTNLVHNAVEFSRIGGTVAIDARKDETHIRIAVEDNGTHIPAYALARIFDKFYSLQRPDSGRKSTGLGLNLVRQVALLHGGDVRLENRNHQGVRAVLTLPSEDG